MSKTVYVFIKHSPTFWEVRPPTKTGMRKLLECIRMHKQSKREPRVPCGPFHASCYCD